MVCKQWLPAYVRRRNRMKKARLDVQALPAMSRETLLLCVSVILSAIAVFAIIRLTFADALGSMFTKWVIILLVSYGFSVMAFHPRLLRIKYQLLLFLLILLAISRLPDAPWQWVYHNAWRAVYKDLVWLFIVIALVDARHLANKINKILYCCHLIALALFAGTWYL